MSSCQYCGKPLPEEASFCPSCGKPVASESGPQSTADGEPLVTTNDIVLKKKILSVREHYDLEDRNGIKLGEADGNLIQLPAKFTVMDNNRLVLMRMEGKVLAIRKQFTFYDNVGQELGVMRKKIVKLIGEEYWVEKNGIEFMRIYGDFAEHDYQMEVGGAPVAQVHKKWFAIRDQLGISIMGRVDHRIVIGAVIMIEHVEVTERNR